MTDINTVVGNITTDKQAIKEEIGYRDNVIPLFIVSQGTSAVPNNLNIYHSPVKLHVRDTTGDFIWGRDDWGSKNWGGSYSESRVIYRIVNADNIFREYFRTSTFINSSATTATVDTTNNEVVF